MAIASITSNEGELPSASAVLLLRATNPQYNQLVLRIEQTSDKGGAPSIRIDDPNPDIGFVETGQGDPDDPGKRKYEIDVQEDKLRINGRAADNRSFEPIVVFQRLAAGGNIGVRTKDQFGRSEGVLTIKNAYVAPSVNPSDGGILYVEDGHSSIEAQVER
jgi:hypothetical protein